MAAPDDITRRLADLLRGPRETLDVEIKGWIDIVNNQDHRALLAKALIALANPGGGAVVVGFERSQNGKAPAQTRPTDPTPLPSDTRQAGLGRDGAAACVR